MSNEFQALVLNAKAELNNTITKYITENIKQVSRAEQEELRKKYVCHGHMIETTGASELPTYAIEIMSLALSRKAAQLMDENLDALENAQFTYSFEDDKVLSLMTTAQINK